MPIPNPGSDYHCAIIVFSRNQKLDVPEIAKHFQTFGYVVSVKEKSVKNKKKKAYIVEFSSRESQQNAFQQKNHMIENIHVDVRIWKEKQKPASTSKNSSTISTSRSTPTSNSTNSSLTNLPTRQSQKLSTKFLKLPISAIQSSLTAKNSPSPPSRDKKDNMQMFNTVITRASSGKVSNIRPCAGCTFHSRRCKVCNVCGQGGRKKGKRVPTVNDSSSSNTTPVHGLVTSTPLSSTSHHISKSTAASSSLTQYSSADPDPSHDKQNQDSKVRRPDSFRLFSKSSSITTNTVKTLSKSYIAPVVTAESIVQCTLKSALNSASLQVKDSISLPKSAKSSTTRSNASDITGPSPETKSSSSPSVPSTPSKNKYISSENPAPSQTKGSTPSTTSTPRRASKPKSTSSPIYSTAAPFRHNQNNNNNHKQYYKSPIKKHPENHPSPSHLHSNSQGPSPYAPPMIQQPSFEDTSHMDEQFHNRSLLLGHDDVNIYDEHTQIEAYSGVITEKAPMKDEEDEDHSDDYQEFPPQAQNFQQNSSHGSFSQALVKHSHSNKSHQKVADVPDQSVVTYPPNLCPENRLGLCGLVSLCDYVHQACKDGTNCLKAHCPLGHPIHRKRFCNRPDTCWRQGCALGHSQTWPGICPKGQECIDFACRFTHPVSRVKKCLRNVTCFDHACPFLHPSTWYPCEQGEHCQIYECVGNHPPQRLAKCEFSFFSLFVCSC